MLRPCRYVNRSSVLAFLLLLRVAGAAQPSATTTAPTTAPVTAEALIDKLRPIFPKGTLKYDDAAIKDATLTINNLRVVESVGGHPTVTFSARRVALKLKQPFRSGRPAQFDEVALDHPVWDARESKATPQPASAPVDGAVLGAMLTLVKTIPPRTLRTLQIKDGRAIGKDDVQYGIDLDLRRTGDGDYQFRLIHRGERAGHAAGTLKFDGERVSYSVQGDLMTFPEELPPATQPAP
jgi:hypothetical protein